MGAAAVVGGMVVAAGVGAYAASSSADTAADAQMQAANTQAASADAATATQWNMFRQSREDQLPWLQTGARSLSALEKKITAGPGKFTEDPGYQSRLAEGNKQIGRTASATGGIASGSTLKALTRYGQDYASNEYDKWLQRYYQSLTPYQSLASVGQTTASGLGKEGAYTGAQVGQNTIAAGNARASGYLGQAAGSINQTNAWTGAAQGGLNALGTYYGNQPTTPSYTQPTVGPTSSGGYWT
jgi:hypothetical protein